MFRVLMFLGEFEQSFWTVNGALLDVFWVSNSPVRKVKEQCKDFFYSNFGFVFCEKSES